LHHEESLAEEVATLRQARAMVAAFATEQAQWHAQREPLAAEIAALEAALGEHTRQLLGVKD
jgi:hypothetical protein